MKKAIAHMTLLAWACLFAACDKKSEDAKAPAAAPPNEAAAQAAVPDPSLPEIKVEITGNDQMKFDVTAIEAQAGQKVTVTLKNIGSMPKLSMGHNFVLLANDMDPMKFIEASGVHMARDFIAPELASKVIAHTKLLGPGETDTVSFAAPRVPGDYTFVCTFPGHFPLGMRGILTVK